MLVNILSLHLHVISPPIQLNNNNNAIIQSNNKIYVSFPLKLNFDLDRGVFPMVIQAVVDEGDGRLPEL